jgi:putative peptidoglycan lipid II flippase
MSEKYVAQKNRCSKLTNGLLRPWGGRTFRFNLKNFHFGAGFSLRRFSIMEAILLLMLALLASRGLGVVRQGLFNALFGTGLEANAYNAASRLPETILNLIAGGALSHAFIPVFLSYEKDQGQREAWRLTSLVFNIFLVMLTFAVIIAEFLTPTFVTKILVPGYSPAEQALTSDLTRVMLIQPLMMGLGTIVTSILSSKRQFLLPAISMAVYNLGLIGGLLVTLALPGIGIYGPTYGTLAAAAIQCAVQIPALLKQGVRYSFYWNLCHPGLREVLRLLGPNVLSVGVVYVAVILETTFISWLPDSASLSALHNAQMLQALPVALMSHAIGQALLPDLTVQAAAGRYFRMRQTALKVMGVSILLMIPVAILLAALGVPMIRLLFEHGAFDLHSSELTYLALLGYAIALPGTAASDLITRGFFALKDAHTPLLSNTFALITRVGLIMLCFALLEDHLLILSIPLALAGSATAEAVLLWLILFFRLNKQVKMDRGMQRLRHRQQKRQLI